MRTVSQAIADGWQPLLPLERSVHDPNVILMTHLRTDGLRELGFAEMEAASQSLYAS
ncbi:MAG: hypothetical protein GIW99_09025 [Candidatus Eremiobacteraeota bacterium]|nr:hypothetical protein [Candidatus Eremiobacteraeota bacterium]MBC5827805.1 hypothetical protein [Candidatus Eremiobacteraeota bacterium]